jgi:DNA-binding MarR family transcriptional regulator
MDNTRGKLAERFVELMDQISVKRRPSTPGWWDDLELTMPQARTLFYLSHGPRRMSDISANVGRGMSSATSMIDRLVKRRLVQRLEDASDRRVVECRLTSQGEDLVERFLRLGRMRNEAIAETLTLEELEVVVPAMEILSRAVRRERDRSEASQPA